MARLIRDWLLRQLNSRDVLDGVSVTIRLAVAELGPAKVAQELRRMTKQLDRTGNVTGWNFPRTVAGLNARTEGQPEHLADIEREKRSEFRKIIA